MMHATEMASFAFMTIAMDMTWSHEANRPRHVHSDGHKSERSHLASLHNCMSSSCGGHTRKTS